MIKNRWALILGASSGFGGACAVALARAGMNIFGVHLDRRATMANVEKIISEIEETGRRAIYFNANAADSSKRKEILEKIGSTLSSEQDSAGVKVFLHSLAFGTLKPFIAEDAKDCLRESDMNMTLSVMAHSLVFWVRDLILMNQMGRGARIFAMTSAGGHRVWPSYGAVSAAKAALESHIRQLSVELAPLGIAANALRAGVTQTPALRRIPGSEQMVERALQVNPGKRLTTPQDIASVIVTLSGGDSVWLTGNIIGVDGSEDNAS